MTEAELNAGDTSELVPTSLEDIKKIKTEDVIELPPFLDGTPFVAKLRRPSIARMAKDGRIPNALSAAVDELMDVSNTTPQTPLKLRVEVLELIAASALEDPTYEEVGEYLDHLQLMAIWSYVVSGVNSLIPFRAIRELFATRTYERAVEDTPEPIPAT
jgi:hypothetical protein